MSSDSLLLAVFVGLYLLECVVWVPANGWLFVQKHRWGGFQRRGEGLHLKSWLPGGAALTLSPAPGVLNSPPAAEAVEAVHEKQRALEAQAWKLEISGDLLLLAVAALVFLWHGGPGPRRAEIFLGALIAAALAHFSSGALLWACWAKVHGHTAGRGQAFAIVLLSPWASSRAADHLARPLLQGAHPAAVAEALLGPAERDALAAELWRRASHPKPGEAPEASAWKAWLQGRGHDLAALTPVPAPNQPNAQAFCPRCLTQYTHASGACPDCGVGLAPLA